MTRIFSLAILAGLLAGCAWTSREETPDPRCLTANSQLEPLSLSASELSRLGRRIYQNECGGRYENLVVWNQGEEFPSLGIGHFIWYLQGKDGPFEESFPRLLAFMRSQGTQVPAWLEVLQDAPWPSREIFLQQNNQPLAQALRQFLAQTMHEQTLFITERLNRSLPRLLCAAEADIRPAVRRQFYTVARSPGGLYPLIDYTNFKGEGIAVSERYRGQGWGLLHVLMEMPSLSQPGPEALQAFAAAADRVLTRRVSNAPPARQEGRWLPGWRNRVYTYTAF